MSTGGIIIAVVIAAVGGLALLAFFTNHRCKHCNSRLTWYKEEMSPDFSHGNQRLHLHQWHHCYRCGNDEVIKGVALQGKDGKTFRMG